MDFGKILDSWESNSNKKTNKKRGFERLMDRYPPDGIDSEPLDQTRESSAPGSERKALRELRPQARIDLHGLSAEEALFQAETFLRQSMEAGHAKVLFVHGKGHHSAGGPVLPRAIQEYLRRHKSVGEIGYAGSRDGGSGATWAILRYRSR